MESFHPLEEDVFVLLTAQEQAWATKPFPKWWPAGCCCKRRLKARAKFLAMGPEEALDQEKKALREHLSTFSNPSITLIALFALLLIVGIGTKILSLPKPLKDEEPRFVERNMTYDLHRLHTSYTGTTTEDLCYPLGAQESYPPCTSFFPLPPSSPKEPPFVLCSTAKPCNISTFMDHGDSMNRQHSMNQGSQVLNISFGWTVQTLARLQYLSPTSSSKRLITVLREPYRGTNLSAAIDALNTAPRGTQLVWMSTKRPLKILYEKPPQEDLEPRPHKGNPAGVLAGNIILSLTGVVLAIAIYMDVFLSCSGDNYQKILYSPSLAPPISSYFPSETPMSEEEFLSRVKAFERLYRDHFPEEIPYLTESICRTDACHLSNRYALVRHHFSS